MNASSVAVIIPCYNAGEWVACAIQSVLDQGYPNLEVIVIDDGSTDNSLDVIRSYGDRIRWETGPNRGACAARNRGLALTTAEYVMFLDADDWLAPGAVSNCVRRSLQLPPNVKAIVFGQVVRTDADGNPLSDGRNAWINDGELASEIWIMLAGPHTTTVFHKRSYLLEVNGFDPRKQFGQDFDLHVRLMQSGVAFMHLATPIVYYRQHSSPHRVSHQRVPGRRYWTDSQASNDVEHVYNIALCRGRPLEPRERLMIAKHAWAVGRKYLRAGMPGATSLFDLAKRVCPEDPVVGGAGYRVLCALLGPVRAERIANLRQSITKHAQSHT